MQQLFLVSMLALAAITAVIALLTRDSESGRRAASATTQGAPASTRPAATTGPSASTATTAPATRPIRPTPGNLLADGDFERDLAGWAPLAGTSVERVEGGTSGRWAVALAPGGQASGQAVMTRQRATTARADTTYEAVVWVRGRAGGQVLVALREMADGREVSADEAGYTLPGGGWQQVAVEHRTRVPGSSLAVEVSGLNLPAGDRLLVDGIDLQVE
jgi:Flp pilus assembly protein CpaB